MEIIGFFFGLSLSLLSVSNGKFPSCNRPLFTDHQIHLKSPRWDLRLFFVQHAKWPKFSTKKFFFFGRKCVAWRNRPVVNGAADPLTANVITLNLNRFFLYFFFKFKRKIEFQNWNKVVVEGDINCTLFQWHSGRKCAHRVTGYRPSDNRGQCQLWGDLNGFL